MEKKFSNGFTSWHETHFEVVVAITQEWSKSAPDSIVVKRHQEQGHGGLYELAQELTDEFEKGNKDREWDGEFFEGIEIFLEEKLKTAK